MTDHEELYNELRNAVLAMEKAENDYGCGFYNHMPWLKAKDNVRELVGLPRNYKDYQFT